MKTTKKLIGMIARPMVPLVAKDWNGPDIRADIAQLSTDRVVSPRNWRQDENEPRNSCGGCFARVFASTAYPNSPSKGWLGCYGPEISYGTRGEYEHGAAALRTIEKRSEALYAARGGTIDAADALGRWLEACGVSEVWIAEDAASMLNESTWRVLTIGRAVFEVRQCLPETVALRAELLAKEAREVAEREARETSGVA